MTDLKLLAVDLIDDLWYLDVGNEYGYSGWSIGGVQALDQNPRAFEPAIPEPGTLMLVGLGFGIFALIRNVLRKRK